MVLTITGRVTGNSIFKLASGGNSWTLYYTAPSDVTSMLLWNNQFFITTAEDGILFTTDHGLTWYSMNIGLTDLGLNTIALYDTTLLCGTRTKGIFMFDGNQWIADNQGMICSSIRWMIATSGNVFSNDGDSIHVLKDKKWINTRLPGGPVTLYPNPAADYFQVTGNVKRQTRLFMWSQGRF